MLIRILGSAAGGGLPQWNCHCPTCTAARTGTVAPRLQSSIAVRGDGGGWFLVNASPDVRAQLALLPAPGTAIRSLPVEGVLLTDAEIDHTAGLLVLREASRPLPLFGSRDVRRALTEGFPLLRMLAHYCGVDWHDLEPGASLALPGSTLAVESFPTGGDAPLYAGPGAAPIDAVALTFRDSATGTTLTYAPGVARLDEDVLARFASSDVVLVDGTFWHDDELARLGISQRTAADMGHVPLSGSRGMVEALRALERPRKILVHINNTNPILFESSPERAALLGEQIEVAYDGLEVAL